MYSPSEMASICSDVGAAKSHLGAVKAFVLAVFAGVFIALGGLASTASAVAFGGAAERVVRAAVFPAGLTFVVVAGAELFTGNCLMLMAVLEKRCSFRRVLRQWAIVYAGNFAGSLLVAVWTVASGLASSGNGWLGRAFVLSAINKTSYTWWNAFLRGVGCNFLVCLAVWLTYSTKSTAGKIMALWPAIFLFIVCSLEHSVANMSGITTGMLIEWLRPFKDVPHTPTVWQFLWRNLIPVTLGNIVGGTMLTAGYFAAYRYNANSTAS